MEEIISALRQNVEDGILTQEFVDQLIRELTGDDVMERTDFWITKDNLLVCVNHIETIKENLPYVVKDILENKWKQQNIKLDSIKVVSSSRSEFRIIYSIYYINKYGQKIPVSLQDVYDVLIRVDFDEDL
jgi:hypothetical protein